MCDATQTPGQMAWKTPAGLTVVSSLEFSSVGAISRTSGSLVVVGAAAVGFDVVGFGVVGFGVVGFGVVGAAVVGVAVVVLAGFCVAGFFVVTGFGVVAASVVVEGFVVAAFVVGANRISFITIISHPFCSMIYLLLSKLLLMAQD